MRTLTTDDMTQAAGGLLPAILLTPTAIKGAVTLGSIVVGYAVSRWLK